MGREGGGGEKGRGRNGARSGSGANFRMIASAMIGSGGDITHPGTTAVTFCGFTGVTFEIISGAVVRIKTTTGTTGPASGIGAAGKGELGGDGRGTK